MSGNWKNEKLCGNTMPGWSVFTQQLEAASFTVRSTPDFRNTN
jgi:hypothetical protein